MMDGFEMLDPETGENLVKEGHVGRWVRQHDLQGTQIGLDSRMEGLVSEGYEPIRTNSGEILKGDFGLAMQISNEKHRERLNLHSPYGVVDGVFDRNSVKEEIDKEIDFVNNKKGRRVVRVVAWDIEEDPPFEKLPGDFRDLAKDDDDDRVWLYPKTEGEHTEDTILAERMHISLEECIALRDESGDAYRGILNARKEKTKKESYWLGRARKE